MTLFEPVLAALDAADVRYVVVGGVAVVLHGHPRMTADLDLVIDLAAEAAGRAIDALVGLGMEPRLPVDPHLFADPDVRRGWVEDRNLSVFTLLDPAEPLLEVDLFAASPIPFDDLWQQATLVELAGQAVRVASIEHLITMKKASGRPQDLADVTALEALDG